MKKRTCSNIFDLYTVVDLEEHPLARVLINEVVEGSRALTSQGTRHHHRGSEKQVDNIPRDDRGCQLCIRVFR